ncbi:hypothetical protein [Pseudaminobacter sp. NGMCC 1.201702]|uniref:hypothetical protein n=1 Tax=Pseudaminobacter sp. NGMCC 1.201702 TaxID=3391825 RepID=UPI0039EFAB57
MTVKLASLKADLAREAEGDWIEYPDWPGVEFNVSSLHLPAFTIARDLMYQRFARVYKRKPVPKDVLSAEIGKLFHAHILHGWRGLDVPFSKETALETLTNPEYRNVVAAVEWCAAKVSDLDIEFVEDAEKNSAAPSAKG